MNGVPVARVLGFEIRIHLSWAIVLAVILVSVVQQIGAVEPSIDDATRWLIGIAVAGAFMLSAVLHELAHAIVARRAGVHTPVLVILFFGGTASAGLEAPRPRDEVAIAFAGPAVSLAIGGGMVLAGLLMASFRGPILAVGEIVLAVGLLNLLLGGINLLPAYPLDGGRLVQGLAWMRTGDPGRAMRIAARSGRLLGWGIAGLGLGVVLVYNTVDGLMLAVLGWFLTSAARQVERRAVFDELLEGVPVSDVMERDAPEVGAGLTLDTFAGRMLDGTVSPALPVMRDRELVGIVTAGQVRRVRRQRWNEMRAEDLMLALESLPRIGLETSVRAAFEELRRSGQEALPVVESAGGGLAGIVTRRGVIEALRRRAELRGVSFL